MPIGRPTFPKFAKRAGAIVLALIALDLAAGAAAVAFGARWLHR